MDTIQVKKDSNHHLGVILSVSLTPYFTACRDLQRLEEEYVQSKDDSELASIMDHKLTTAKKIFKQERELLGSELFGIFGDRHWQKIKEALREQCELQNPAEQKLSVYLKSGEAGNGPLALEALDVCFIELLKNSIDANLKAYLCGQSENTEVKIATRLEVENERLNITVKDNGSGFPASFLSNFESYIQTKAYKTKTASQDKSDAAQFYLGGAGRGIPQLLCYLLDGELLNAPGKYDKIYEVDPHSTGIKINNGHGATGANISLCSPLKAYKPHKAPHLSDSVPILSIGQRYRRFSQNEESSENKEKAVENNYGKPFNSR